MGLFNGRKSVSVMTRMTNGEVPPGKCLENLYAHTLFELQKIGINTAGDIAETSSGLRVSLEKGGYVSIGGIGCDTLTVEAPLSKDQISAVIKKAMRDAGEEDQIPYFYGK